MSIFYHFSFNSSASYNDPHAMFPSASKLFSGMNMGAHIAHDPRKKKSSEIITEESEEGGSLFDPVFQRIAFVRDSEVRASEERFCPKVVRFRLPFAT